MKILKSIGSFFAAIWRWIKNTAWVQPLLIVGAIFGVIFSIPAITSAIQGAINNANSAETYLKKYQASMEGGATSDADKILNYTFEDLGKIPESDKKFFILFTKSGDTELSNCKIGFEKLQAYWGNTLKPKDGRNFKLYTIFTNETTTETTSKQSAFCQFLDRHSDYFEKAAQAGFKSTYYTDKKKITKDQLEKIQDADESTFITPTIILMDFTDKKTEGTAGISRICFSVTGSDDVAKGQFLYDVWNGTGDFDPTKH